MNIHCVNLGLQLPDDELVDLFLFQWHTPEPREDGTFRKIASPYTEQKRAILEQFRDWFLGRPDLRTAFVILPEMSVPLSCVDVLADLAGRATSPLVVIGGIEPLPWTEYLTFARSMVNTPAVERIGEGNPASLWVNTTGIWIRADDGSVLKYTQPKLHPSDGELPQFHKGENVIVFRSTDQSSHKRLNFCVQICSDFCSRRFVSDLRADIGRASPGLHLDFLFLPQHNPNQEAAQFKESVEAYYDVAQRGVQTNEGCLVFVNNANERQGKSSAYGSSRAYFPYRIWREQEVPSATYWLKNYATYQAAIVRESGPGLYWFTYTPYCWLDRQPGAGHVLPYATGGFCAIEADHLETRPTPLWAEAHWLRNEWAAGTSEFVTDITESSTPGVLVAAKAESCGDAYGSCTQGWCYYLAPRPEIAKDAINRYFCCWKDLPAYPAREAEPNRWSDDVPRGMTKFMQTYSLLQMGAPDAILGIRPECDRSGWHAAIGGNVYAVFLWGNSKRPARLLITACRSTALEVALLSRKVLLVPVDPAGTDGPDQLRDMLQVDPHSVAKADDLEGLPDHLGPSGGVVEPTHGRCFNMIHNHMLLQEAYEARDEADLRSRLARVLRTELG